MTELLAAGSAVAFCAMYLRVRYVNHRLRARLFEARLEMDLGPREVLPPAWVSSELPAFLPETTASEWAR